MTCMTIKAIGGYGGKSDRSVLSTLIDFCDVWTQSIGFYTVYCMFCNNRPPGGSITGPNMWGRGSALASKVALRR